MNGHVTGVHLLDALHEQILRPRPALDRADIVFVLQHHRQRPPVALRLVGVEPALRRIGHEDGIVAPGDAFRARVVEKRIVSALVPRAGHVVRDHELRVRKALEMKINVFFHIYVHLLLRHLRRHDRVPFAPEAIGTDVHERHLGTTVIAPRESLEKVLELYEEDRVGEVGVHQLSLLVRTLPPCPSDALRAGVKHPLGRGMLQPAFGAGDAERDLPAALDPALRGRVERRPVVLSLLWLQVRPRNAQVADRTAGEPRHRIARLEGRTVVKRHVRVVVHGPAHARIHKRASVVRRPHRRATRHERDRRDGNQEKSYFHHSPFAGNSPAALRANPSLTAVVTIFARR